MGRKSDKNLLTLFCLDIEGGWNVPLLKNAADICGALLEFKQSNSKDKCCAQGSVSILEVEELLSRYNCVLGCERVKKSQSIYELTAPRGRVAIVVGNELSGIPSETINSLADIISIPIAGRGMTSINVAAAAAIALYVLERDLVRKGIRRCRLNHKSVDLLLHAPEDPSELGSLLRSVWAFGWRKVFLSDPKGVWFTKDRKTIMAGRAAARREVNPLVIASDDQIEVQKYDKIIMCNGPRQGTPLSRLVLPDRGRVLIIYGDGVEHSVGDTPSEQIFVDFCNAKVHPCYRHTGSILLSVISEMLQRVRYG